MSRMSGPAAKSVPFDEMTTDEQIQHVQDLWDIIASKADEVPVTPEHRAELRRRLGAHRDDPDAA